MKYLIIGCGAVGASIAGFLAFNGYEVNCIARGNTLKQIQSEGLILKSDTIGDQIISNINSFTSEEYNAKADVIFVCVKDYSLTETYRVIESASHPNTLVIPVLNTFNVGGRIKANVRTPIVYDGCIYIVAEGIAPGVIRQTTDIFRIITGAIGGNTAPSDLISQLENDLHSSKIKFKISDDIRSAKFTKFSLTSALASTCSYFDITSEYVQKDGQYRNFLRGTLNELKELAFAMDLNLTIDIVEDNLKIIDKFLEGTTTSMQRDLRANKVSEIQGMVFDIIDLGKKYNVNMPHYSAVGEKFKLALTKY